jgi:hypothetical protein
MSDVERKCRRSITDPTQAGGHILDFITASRDKAHLGPGLGQRYGASETDSSACAGHHCSLAVKPKARCFWQ